MLPMSDCVANMTVSYQKCRSEAQRQVLPAPGACGGWRTLRGTPLRVLQDLCEAASGNDWRSGETRKPAGCAAGYASWIRSWIAGQMTLSVQASVTVNSTGHLAARALACAALAHIMALPVLHMGPEEWQEH